MLELFPDTARIDGGALSIGGVAAADLAAEFGTPLVVYDEATIRAQARAYRAAAPDGFIAYGTKAFPNVAILRAALETVAWLATFAAKTRSDTGWYPRTVDLGGGLGVRTAPDEPELSISEFVSSVLAELERTFRMERLPLPQVILEPGRSLVG